MLKKLIALAMVTAMCGCVITGCGGNDNNNASSSSESSNASASPMVQREAVQSTDNYRNFYQIFMYSFCDSNNDGIGDIPGIISKLDYLNDGNPKGGDDIGVDGLWLTPICQSESYHKYSVEDYCSIDESFGTMEDFEKLISECKNRGINVIIDLVINHSSNKHEWFTKACDEVRNGNLDGYAQYYHIVKEDDKVSSCTYYPISGTDYFYEANFSDTMPELNVSNEKVREEIKNIIKFWFDKGVAGFRLDAIKYYDTGGDDGKEFCKWFVDTAKELKEDAYIVGENWSGTSQINEWYSTGIDSQFNFPMSQAQGAFETAVRSGNIQKLCNSLKSWGEQVKEANPNAIDCCFLSNHDMVRSGASLAKDIQNEKMAAMCYMLAPGNSYTYYGEEVGLVGSQPNNDGTYRLPMPWTGNEWENITIPNVSASVAEEAVITTVEEAQKDDKSLLKTYNQLIQLKLENPEIARGQISDVIETENDYGAGFVTKYKDSGVIVFYNLSKTETVTTEISKDLLNYEGISGQVTAQDSDVKAELKGTTLTVPPMTVVVMR